MAHKIPREELVALVDQVNKRLCDDPLFKDVVPLVPPEKVWTFYYLNFLTTQLFEVVKDAFLLSKLIAEIEPEAIDLSDLHNPVTNQYQALENQTVFLNAARRMG